MTYQINFRKLVTQKEVVEILMNFVNAIGTSFWIEDTNGQPLFGSNSDNSGSRYPVTLLDEVIGCVVGDQKTVSIASLLSFLAQQQYEKKSLANELLEKYQEIDIFHDISTQITASLDPKEVARLVIEEAKKLIQSTKGSILLLNEKTNRLEILWEDGQIGSLTKSMMLSLEIVSTILQSGQGEIVNDVSSDPRFVKSKTNICSLICAPLMTKKQVIGAIVISSETPITYSTNDLKLLTILSLQTAVAIEKGLLYEQSCNTAKVAQEQAQQLQRTLYELQQTQTKLIQSEKMSNLGQLVAGVAHEINNPINYIAGNLNYAQQYTQQLLYLLQLYQKHNPQPVTEIQAVLEELDLEFLIQDFTNLLSSMHLGVGRIRQLALSLRNFSRLDQAEMKPVDIHEGIDTTLLILQSRLKPNERHLGIEVIKKYGDIPQVEGFANQLNQVFMNLIANAIDALEENMGKQLNLKPQICIHTALGSELKADQFNIHSNQILHFPSVIILMSDNGLGMDESILAHLFEPFFTTKPLGKGTGLGLSISYQIIQKHGGYMHCSSQTGQGTTFCIQIPVKQTVLKSLDTDVTACKAIH